MYVCIIEAGSVVQPLRRYELFICCGTLQLEATG